MWNKSRLLCTGIIWLGFPSGLAVKNASAVQEIRVQSLGVEDPLEEGMATHSGTLAWKIPWMEEPCRLQSMGSLRVGHDWATSLSHIGEGNGNPLQCSCLENPRDGGAWWAAVCGITWSQARLKRLSSRSNFTFPFPCVELAHSLPWF